MADSASHASHEEEPVRLDTKSDAETDAPVFPSLENNAATTTPPSSEPGNPARIRTDIDNDQDEPAVATPFVRATSPDSAAPRGLPPATANAHDKTPDRMTYKMHKFSLYETASRFYIIGVDVSEKWYRVLKIDRTADGAELNMTDDKIVYSIKEMNQLLDTIDDGNKASGGIKLRCTTWGLLGFIKFTGPYYMLLITKKSTVAMIGGHYIYQIEATELVPLTPARHKPDSRNTEEQRFLGILNNLDLTRSFYYSYSYDVTRTLQHNITRERNCMAQGRPMHADDDLNGMFVWNDYLLQPAAASCRDPFDWCRPIIHGYIDQAALSIYGRTAHITVIARRSRYFAGARFLKRGANDLVGLNREPRLRDSMELTSLGLRRKRRRDGANCSRVPHHVIPSTRSTSVLQPSIHILCPASRQYTVILDSRQYWSDAEATDRVESCRPLLQRSRITLR